MKIARKLFVCGMLFTTGMVKIEAAAIKPLKPKSVNKHVAQHAARFFAHVSIGFFALGQSSYHLGNLLSGSSFETQLKGTNAYSQSLRFAIGMVGTSLLLLAVSCLDHFGYSDLGGNTDELVETENIVDGTPQAPTN